VLAGGNTGVDVDLGPVISKTWFEPDDLAGPPLERLDAEREKLSAELNELEIAERVLARLRAEGGISYTRRSIAFSPARTPNPKTPVPLTGVFSFTGLIRTRSADRVADQMISPHGARKIVLLRTAALACGACLLPIPVSSGPGYVAFAVISVGWATMGGATIDIIVAPWLKRRRGMAVSWEMSGPSAGGVLIVPLLTVLTGADRPFRRDGYLASMLAVLVRKTPQPAEIAAEGLTPGLFSRAAPPANRGSARSAPDPRSALLSFYELTTTSPGAMPA
jgi:hypothetical protein